MDDFCEKFDVLQLKFVQVVFELVTLCFKDKRNKLKGLIRLGAMLIS